MVSMAMILELLFLTCEGVRGGEEEGEGEGVSNNFFRVK